MDSEEQKRKRKRRSAVWDGALILSVCAIFCYGCYRVYKNSQVELAKIAEYSSYCKTKGLVYFRVDYERYVYYIDACIAARDVHGIESLHERDAESHK